MFLRHKKGDMILQFAILATIAVIMILLVTGFGAKIWTAFFPNGDKSTLKSFEAVYNMIESKSISLKEYDSSILNIYLKEGHKMVFFEDSKLACAPTVSGYDRWFTYTAPKSCNGEKQCLCLYDDVPSGERNEAEKNLISCHPFPNQYYININTTYFDINKVACRMKNRVVVEANTDYGTYIFIKRIVDDKPYLYVLEATDANKKLDAEWAKEKCISTKDKENDWPCNGRKVGEIVTATNESSANHIYQYCNNLEPKIQSFAVECNYDEKEEMCVPDCSIGDITKKCKTYNTCEDINNILGVRNQKYLSIEDDYAQYRMCLKDDNLCAIGFYTDTICGINPLEIYPLNASVSGGISNTLPKEAECDIKYSTWGTERFITYYDPKCEDEYNKIFYEKSTMMACKKSYITECKDFIQNKTKAKDCELKYMSNGDIYWLTHYKIDTCTEEVSKMFAPALFCNSYY